MYDSPSTFLTQIYETTNRLTMQCSDYSIGPLETSNAIIESAVFGPVCPQYVSRIPIACALNITGNLVEEYGEGLLAGCPLTSSIIHKNTSL